MRRAHSRQSASPVCLQHEDHQDASTLLRIKIHSHRPDRPPRRPQDDADVGGHLAQQRGQHLDHRAGIDGTLQILPDDAAQRHRGIQLLQRPGVSIDDIEPLLAAGPLDLGKRERESLEIDLKYRGYIRRQARTAEKLKRMERRRIPDGFSYRDIKALSTEAKEVLEKFRPETLGKAARLAGVRNSDVSVLMVFLERAGDD